MSNSIPQSLGAFLEYVMEKRGISGNALSKGLGIAESSVRNLLKYGIEPETPSPKPETLRKLGVYFGINPIYLFQLADYLPSGSANLSHQGAMVGRRFDQLSSTRQSEILALLERFEQIAEEKKYGETYVSLLPQARELIARRESIVFTADWYFDHIVGTFLKATPGAAFTPDSELLNIPYSYRANEGETRYPYVHMIRQHLDQVFGGHRTISIEEIEKTLDHPIARAMINLLLPNREMNIAGKLFYLTASAALVNEDIGRVIGFDVVSTATHQNIEDGNQLSRDIWLFLERASGNYSIN